MAGPLVCSTPPIMRREQMEIGAHQIRRVRRPRRSMRGTAMSSMAMLTTLRWVISIYLLCGSGNKYSLCGNCSIERVFQAGHVKEVARVGAHDGDSYCYLPVPGKERNDQAALLIVSSNVHSIKRWLIGFLPGWFPETHPYKFPHLASRRLHVCVLPQHASLHTLRRHRSLRPFH